jgi:hypothetical protein
VRIVGGENNTYKKIVNGGSSLSEVNTGFHGIDLMGVFRQAHRCGVETKLLETLRLRGWLWSLQRGLTRDATSKAFQAGRVF